MIRDFLSRIISIKNTPQGRVLTIFGEEYIPIKSIELFINKIKILEAAMEKRIATIRIMDERLKRDKELIERMHRALGAQNQQMHEQLNIINRQRSQLKHIEQLNWKLTKLKHEQKKIVKMSGM
ncbi:MAG: hypothetical protein LUB59_02380 [Candidatus Gastranaerophilales bacterium]|nr:hypothetical protein [Candidatus Gastranaerophilales bacterium]